MTDQATQDALALRNAVERLLLAPAVERFGGVDEAKAALTAFMIAYAEGDLAPEPEDRGE